MAALIITPDDLQAFKKELLHELNELLQKQSKPADTQWLKSKEVRKRLNISPSTLQNLRLKGTLPYTRIGGVLYYDASDIERILEQNRSVVLCVAYLFGEVAFIRVEDTVDSL